jgi:hypothetical protein
MACRNNEIATKVMNWYLNEDNEYCKNDGYKVGYYKHGSDPKPYQKPWCPESDLNHTFMALREWLDKHKDYSCEITIDPKIKYITCSLKRRFYVTYSDASNRGHEAEAICNALIDAC